MKNKLFFWGGKKTCEIWQPKLSFSIANNSNVLASNSWNKPHFYCQDRWQSPEVSKVALKLLFLLDIRSRTIKCVFFDNPKMPVFTTFLSFVIKFWILPLIFYLSNGILLKIQCLFLYEKEKNYQNIDMGLIFLHRHKMSVNCN